MSEMDDTSKVHPMSDGKNAGNNKKSPWTFQGVIKDLKEFAKENPLAAGIVGTLVGLGVLAVIMPNPKKKL